MVHGIWWGGIGVQYLAKVGVNHSLLVFASNSYVCVYYSALHVMQVRKERNQNPWTPLAGLVPYFLTWILVPAYLYQHPIILEQHLIPFTFYIGLINAFSVGQMIVAHLAKLKEFPRYNILSLPLGLAVFDSLGPMLGVWPSVLGDGTYQIAFVFSCLGLAVGVYGSFVVSALWSTSRLLLLTRSQVRYYHNNLRLPRHLVFDHKAPS